MALNLTGELRIVLRVDNADANEAIRSTIAQLGKLDAAAKQVGRKATKQAETQAAVQERAAAKAAAHATAVRAAMDTPEPFKRAESAALSAARVRGAAALQAQRALAQTAVDTRRMEQATRNTVRDALLQEYIAGQRQVDLQSANAARIADVRSRVARETEIFEQRFQDRRNRALAIADSPKARFVADLRAFRDAEASHYVSRAQAGAAFAAAELKTAQWRVLRKSRLMDQYREREAARVKASEARATEAATTGSDFSQVAGAFTTMFVAREVARVLGAVIAPAVDMDEALARLRVTTGAAASELGGYQKAAIAAAAATRFSPTEAVEGMSELALAGIRGQDAFEAIMPVLDLAQARTLSVGMAAQTAGQIFKQFNLAGADLTLALDQLHEVSRSMGVSLTNPLDTVSKLGAAAIRTSGSFSEMLIAFNLAARGMANQALAGTDLNALFTELSDPSKRKSFGEAFKIPTEYEGRWRSASDMIADAAAKMAELTPTQRQIALSSTDMGRIATKALTPMIATLTRGIAGYKDLNGQLLKGRALLDAIRKHAEAAGGSLKEAAAIALDTFNGQLERMKENAGNILMVAATPSMKSLTGVFRFLGDAADAVSRLADLHPQLADVVKTVFKLALAIASVGVALAFVAGAQRLLSHGLGWASGQLALSSIWTWSKAKLALLAFGSSARFPLERLAELGSRLGIAALAAVSFYGGLKIGELGMIKLSMALRAAQGSSQRFNDELLREIYLRGWLNSFLEEAYGLYRRLLGLDVIDAQTAHAKAIKALDDAQKEYNGSLSDYLQLIGRAAAQDWPPRIHADTITNTARAMAGLANATGDTGEAYRAFQSTRLLNAPLEAILARGDKLTAQQTLDWEQNRLIMGNAVAQALPGARGAKLRAANMQDLQASQQARSAEGVFNTASVELRGAYVSRGNWGQPPAAQTAAADRMGLSNLARLDANVQAAQINVTGDVNVSGRQASKPPVPLAQRAATVMSLGEEAHNATLTTAGTAAVFGPVGGLIAATLTNLGAKMGRFSNAADRLAKLQPVVHVEFSGNAPSGIGSPRTRGDAGKM